MNQLDFLKKEGFVKLTDLFSNFDKEVLKSECIKMIRQKPYIKMSNFDELEFKYRMPVMEAKDRLVLENILGISSKVDNIMEKFFSNPKLKYILENTLGKGYKLWSCGIRMSLTNSSQLGFHNDAIGESGISILLEDQNDDQGVTCLIPKSHIWPYQSQQTGIETFPMWIFKSIYASCNGKIGDTFIFFKKTAHGRLPNKKAKPALIMLIALYSQGYSYKPFKIDDKTLSSLGPELRRLLNIDDLEKRSEDKKYEFYIKKENNKNNFIDLLYEKKVKKLSPWKLLRLTGIIIHLISKSKNIFRFRK